MLLINLFQKAKKGNDVVKASKKNISCWQELLLGMTSILLFTLNTFRFDCYRFIDANRLMVFYRNDFRKKRPSTKNNFGNHRFNRNGVCYEFDPKQCRIGLARYRLGLWRQHLYHNHVYR
jgi:hypothetical protein